MRRIYTCLMMAVLSLAVLTSCDRDAMDARTLDGVWRGYISTYYEDRWGISGSDYQTTFAFLQKNTYSGIGYEEDSGYNGYFFAPFEWDIRNGNIYLYYPDEDFTYVIYAYSLSGDYFRGEIEDYTNRRVSFSLTYVGSFSRNYYDSHRYSTWRGAAVGDDAGGEVYTKGRTFATGVFAKAIRQREQQKQ